jgi:alkyl sulfatase BDS1-like metallo-beta-lactamase superfamily hydrolase
MSGSSRFRINKSWFKTLRAPLSKLKPPITDSIQQGAVVLRRGNTILRLVTEGDPTGKVIAQTGSGITVGTLSLVQPHTQAEKDQSTKVLIDLFLKAEEINKKPKQ